MFSPGEKVVYIGNGIVDNELSPYHGKPINDLTYGVIVTLDFFTNHLGNDVWVLEGMFKVGIGLHNMCVTESEIKKLDDDRKDQFKKDLIPAPKDWIEDFNRIIKDKVKI